MKNEISHKTCTKCGATKPLDEFYKVKRAKPKVRNVPHDGHKPMCKSCYVARAKVWAKDNPEKAKQAKEKWADANQPKILAAAKRRRETGEWQERNRVWRKNNTTEYARNRRQNDPLFALKTKMRNLLRKAFDRNGYTKRSKSNVILGCSWAEFMLHLERQFQPGMTWANRGEWHIDHITPLATAATEEDVIRLNHYTNLQPLWAVDNLRKSAKLDYYAATP